MQSQAVPSDSVRSNRMDNMSLPDQARYGADAVLLKSSKVSHKFFPQNNGVFGPSVSRTIRFDVSSPNFLDLAEARFAATYKCTNVDSSAVSVLDGGLGGCISRISINNANGQLLERIDDYALLQTVLTQCSERVRDDRDALYLEENFIGDAKEIFLPESGSSSSFPTIFVMQKDNIRDLTHKLQGAWFQTQKKKLLPPGIAFQLEIELVPNVNEAIRLFNNTGAGGFELSDCYLSIPSVQIMSQAFEDNTARLMSRGYTWAGSTYKRYTFSKASAGPETITVPDKSLALTGFFAVARLDGDIGQADKYQNYFRSGNAFDVDFNLQIGSQQYPPSKIKYAPATNARSAGSYKLSQPSSQISAVLGNVPLSSDFSKNFGNAAQSGGLGFQAVQVGYAQGIGIDTQTNSLPVLFQTQTSVNSLTLTLFCQSTATFRMMPNMGQLEVQSYI